jgi:hypothetical protein
LRSLRSLAPQDYEGLKKSLKSNMKTSGSAGQFNSGQGFIGGRASDMEARARSKHAPYAQYVP